METMASKNLSAILVAVLAFAVFAATASAAGAHILSVEVDGIETGSIANIGVFAGESVPIKVVFHSNLSAEDVRVKAWVSGDKELAVSSERFDVIADRTYSKYFTVRMPANIDPNEDLTLNVLIESKDGSVEEETTIPLSVQRESYLVEVLSVNMDSNAKAGEVLPVDVVLKNRGRHFSEDTFVTVRIPELGIEQRAYFGDLSPVDQGGSDEPEKDDAAERRVFVKIPANAATGLYTVEIEAFNADAVTTVQKKLLIGSGMDDSQVIVPSTTKTVAPGATATHRITVVNRGSTVQVYEFAIDQPDGLSVDVDEPVLVVPAGSSRTLEIKTSATRAGTYSFPVTITSGSDVIETKTMTTVVAGNSAAFTAGNTTVLLTVILAIVFVVLLVVLIVLLTRKPAKSEEYGESYY